jgi:serine protease Do
MKTKFAIPVVAALTLAFAVPALAGGAYCAGKTSAAAAAADHCGSKGAAAAVWAGAWLQRSGNGSVTVAEVAKGSPAARSGLKPGDVVVAVNGYKVGAEKGECLTSDECKVGRSVAYTVQRGRATKVMKLRLEKMPASATERFAHRDASFDPALATLVLTNVN